MTMMRDMDKEKPHCQMVTHMRECMKMANVMAMVSTGNAPIIFFNWY